MKEGNNFPGKLEWALLAGGAALLLSNAGARPVEGQPEPAPLIEPVSTREPFPTMIPSDELPIAVRRPDLDRKPYSKETR